VKAHVVGPSTTCEVTHFLEAKDALRQDLLANRWHRTLHAAAVALYFMYYNFGRVHQTLRVTPAMEAGIANHVWSIEEMVGLLAN
jgi:hypothetical protein